jgi:hypothetical protein
LKHWHQDPTTEEVSEALSELVVGYGYWQGPAWMTLLGEAFNPVEMEKTFMKEMAYLTRYGRFSPEWLCTQTHREIVLLMDGIVYWMEQESILSQANER